MMSYFHSFTIMVLLPKWFSASATPSWEQGWDAEKGCVKQRRRRGVLDDDRRRGFRFFDRPSSCSSSRSVHFAPILRSSAGSRAAVNDQDSVSTFDPLRPGLIAGASFRLQRCVSPHSKFFRSARTRSMMNRRTAEHAALYPESLLFSYLANGTTCAKSINSTL
jgi:hypothetical protein